MCDDTVPQFRVEHDQCQLTFYLPGEAGGLPNSFKVYYVIGGQEMDACETACARRDPLGHTVLYIVSSLAQIERLCHGRGPEYRQFLPSGFYARRHYFQRGTVL